MPMNTMFVTRSGSPSRAPGSSPLRSIALAMRTCSRISAAERLRVRPIWPVAQNGQFMPQPASEEMHSVMRPG